MKRIASIQDVSCLGRCSQTVALPVVSAMGVECAILPTAVLSTHTSFPDFRCTDLTDQLLPIARHWKAQGVKFDALYTGYLASDRQVAVVLALLELLRQAGYEVKGKKVPSLLGGEQKKSIRMDTLGDGYTPADLRAVIAGEKAHTPRKSAAAPVKPEKRSGNLLVDIQTKLRAGKGAGYARWATLFNLKQMAQTVAYLQDHELLDYAVLSEKAAEASAHFNELSARIKASETRMAEIAVLREHIVGYAKTRDTYVAYRKAGYSKKFLAEHESEITIHKAAKNYFDGLGFKKLPTIKALNTEYAELLAEKKAAYAEYRKAREEMKELLTAKANIDRILELDKEQEEANERREKEAEQR